MYNISFILLQIPIEAAERLVLFCYEGPYQFHSEFSTIISF